jgi:hypothetical protein
MFTFTSSFISSETSLLKASSWGLLSFDIAR